jgi:hypothetical protein
VHHCGKIKSALIIHSSLQCIHNSNIWKNTSKTDITDIKFFLEAMGRSQEWKKLKTETKIILQSHAANDYDTLVM